jgi:transposase
MFLKMIQSGITYIADKGYFSFDLVEKVIQMQAFFILRVKENMLLRK